MVGVVGGGVARTAPPLANAEDAALLDDADESGVERGRDGAKVT